MLLTRVINAYIISVDTNEIVGYIIYNNIIRCARASNEYNNIQKSIDRKMKSQHTPLDHPGNLTWMRLNK